MSITQTIPGQDTTSETGIGAYVKNDSPYIVTPTIVSPTLVNPNITGTSTTVNLTATGNTTLGDALTDTTTIKGATSIQTSSASGLAVGLNGATNPAFIVDSSTGSQAAGLKVTGAVAAGTVATAVVSSGANANLTINAKGTGTIGIGSVSTGVVTITPDTTITGVASHSSTTILTGKTTVTAVAGIVSALATTNERIVPFFGAGVQDTPAPAAAIPLTNYFSTLNSTAAATTQTLAASTIYGQVKKIQMIVDGGDDVVTVTSLSGGTTITFADVGDTVELMWNGTNWIAIALYNVADGATAPVLA